MFCPTMLFEHVAVDATSISIYTFLVIQHTIEENWQNIGTKSRWKSRTIEQQVHVNATS